MNLENISVAARISASVIPADPLSAGSYTIGMTSRAHDLGAVSQLYAVKASNITADVTLNLAAGTLTGGGDMIHNGGDGLDADGQPIALDFVYALQIRNTGTQPLVFEITAWTGGDAPFDLLTLPAGGEAVFALPSGVELTVGTMTIGQSGAAPGAFEFIILGKN